MALDDHILEQAAAWVVRTGDPAFVDWEGFTAWLEADPAHSSAYDLVAAAAMDGADAIAAQPAGEAQTFANDDEPAPGVTRRRWIGGALAASLVAVLAFGVMDMRGGSYVVETAAGETRLIALGEGDSIALGGGSRIALDHDDPRFATLEHGQALFSIRHDAANPFRVDVGEDELLDIGTVFDVRHDGNETTVAVSEGVVAFNPGKQNVRINPGKVLTSAEGSDAYALADIAPGQVGEWREGRLTFQNASLSVIADDLSRATGIKFSTSPGAAARRVSGSLLVAPVRSDPRAVGPLLGVTVRPDGKGWKLEAR